MHTTLYVTRYPVFSNTGGELVSAGTVVDLPLLQQLREVAADRTVLPPGCCGFFDDELEAVFERPAYEVLFRDPLVRDTIRKQLHSLVMTRSTLEIMEFFKEKDPYTWQHLLTVFALSTHIGSVMSSVDPSTPVSPGSITHDIGKFSIPLEILQKETPLAAEEQDRIRHHTIAGYILLNYCSGDAVDNHADVIARDHHENLVGTGYPVGRRISDFKTGIVIVCDMYDALLSPRSYRKAAFDNRTALEELTRKALLGLVPDSVVRALVACNRQSERYWQSCELSREVRGEQPKENCYGKTAENIKDTTKKISS